MECELIKLTLLIKCRRARHGQCPVNLFLKCTILETGYHLVNGMPSLGMRLDCHLVSVIFRKNI